MRRLERFRNLNPVIRITFFCIILIIGWLPFSLPLYWLAQTGRMALGGAIATGLLYVGFLILWPWWSNQIHQLTTPWQALGLSRRLSFFNDSLKGFGLGLGCVALLALMQIMAGWSIFHPPLHLMPLIIEGIIVGVLVGIAEELFFRGWLLYELEHGYSCSQALWINALLFAALHFIKPVPAILETLPQFFGLSLLGLLLVWARRSKSEGNSSASLGWPMGIHSGLVSGYYLVSVGSILEVTGNVPSWVTGIEQNPLAGLLGIGILTFIAFIFRIKAQGYYPLKHLA